MKTIATTALVTALAFAGIGGNAEAQRFVETRFDRARVVDVDAVYGRGGPGRIYQECWNQRTGNYDPGYYRDDGGRLYRERDDGTAGAVIGALVGGALGNQVGDGRGQTAATIAGAVIGSRVGKDIDEDNGRYASNNDYYRYRGTSGVETRCRTVQTASRSRMRGYEVTYTYAGREYETFMPMRPGRSIPVEVDVRHGRRGTVVLDVRPRDNYVADYRDDWRD
jgi:uncharacterized protein YcfJ